MRRWRAKERLARKRRRSALSQSELIVLLAAGKTLGSFAYRVVIGEKAS